MNIRCATLSLLSSCAVCVAADEAAPFERQEGYEDTAVGETPRLAEVHEGGGTVRVTTEAPRAGTRCLKITDGQDVKTPDAPRLQYAAPCHIGVARVAFAIRTTPNAVVLHEWRTAADPPRVGPVVRIEAGWITSNGQRLAPMPEGKWVRVEIEMKLGNEADDTFDLVIRQSGQSPERVSELPCADSGVTQIDSIAFSTASTDPTAWWLDDLLIKNLQAPKE